MRRSLRLAGRATVAAAAAADGVKSVVGDAEVGTSRLASRSAPYVSGKKRKRELHVKREVGSAVALTASLDTGDAGDVKQKVVDGVLAEKEPPEGGWIALCSTRELSCSLTLGSGQVFSWRKTQAMDNGESVEWMGVVGRRVYVLRENNATVECCCLFPSDAVSSSDMVAELTQYFRLDVKAAPLYEQWTQPSDRMARIINTLPGLRIVRQDPVECLFSFICSSNNNIQRIQQMVDKLRITYGDHLYTCSSTAHRFHAFPSIDALATECEEAKLRELGFGYRAPFIIKTAQQLQVLGGTKYLLDIRDEGAKAQLLPRPTEYDGSYQDQLIVFAGVGRKVADCVALFSLERLDAIPVDTHVWQIACREFDPSLADKKKSLTPGVYRSVGDHFRSRFTPFAGWAHSVLFAGDLTAFQPLLSEVDTGDIKTLKKVVKKRALTKEVTEKKRTAGSTSPSEQASDAMRHHWCPRMTSKR